MKTSQMIVRVIAVGIVVLAAGCSGNDTTDPAYDADVATVTVRPAVVRGALNGFEGPFDAMTLIAEVRDGRDNLMSDRTVTWQLQLANGTQAGDTIATITSTGTQIATLVFHSMTMVGVVATVRGNDGLARSGTLYVTETP